MKIRCWRSYSDCDYVRGIWHSEDRASWYILIIKAKRCTISRLYFGKQIYMFRTDLLSIIRSLFYVLLTVLLDTILFNDQLDAQFFFVYVYFNSLHVSSIQVLIIKRFNCINTIPCILVCHSGRLVCMFGRTGVPSKPAYQTVTYKEWHVPDIVLIQLNLLMISTWMLETCRELK